MEFQNSSSFIKDCTTTSLLHELDIPIKSLKFQTCNQHVDKLKFRHPRKLLA